MEIHVAKHYSWGRIRLNFIQCYVMDNLIEAQCTHGEHISHRQKVYLNKNFAFKHIFGHVK